MKAYKIKIEKGEMEVPEGQKQVKLLIPSTGAAPQVMTEGVAPDPRDTTTYQEETYELVEAVDPDSHAPLVFMVRTSDADFFELLTNGMERIVERRAKALLETRQEATQAPQSDDKPKTLWNSLKNLFGGSAR